jgi:hypothetical protein
MLVQSSEYPGGESASADKTHVITAKLQSGPRSRVGELSIPAVAAEPSCSAADAGPCLWMQNRSRNEKRQPQGLALLTDWWGDRRSGMRVTSFHTNLHAEIV